MFFSSKKPSKKKLIKKDQAKNKLDIYSNGYFAAVHDIYSEDSPLSRKDKKQLIDSFKEKALSGDEYAKGFMKAVHDIGVARTSEK